MTKRRSWACVVWCVTNAVACADLGGVATGSATASGDSGGDTAGLDESTGGDATGGDSTGDPEPTGGGEPGLGLPCEVDALLATYCRSCHGDPLLGTAFALLTRDDLLAPAPTNPMVSIGERSLVRMQSMMAPMPPLPAAAVPDDAIAEFAAWIDAGMPAGDCVPDDGPSPFDADPVCSSDEWWTLGEESSRQMHPGVACLDCHAEAEDDGPDLLLAGTVYASGHEPDDCFGVQGVQIEVTDANDHVYTLQANAAGNFMLEEDFAPSGLVAPLRVKVISELGEVAMASAAPHGDCNLCHTQDGDEDALGRIVVPW